MVSHKRSLLVCPVYPSVLHYRLDILAGLFATSLGLSTRCPRCLQWHSCTKVLFGQPESDANGPDENSLVIIRSCCYQDGSKVDPTWMGPSKSQLAPVSIHWKCPSTWRFAHLSFVGWWEQGYQLFHYHWHWDPSVDSNLEPSSWGTDRVLHWSKRGQCLPRRGQTSSSRL